MHFTQKEKEAAKTLKAAVCIVIDKLPAGYTLHGWELKELVAQLYPKSSTMYVDTILKRMREYRRASLTCISPSESLYRKSA